MKTLLTMKNVKNGDGLVAKNDAEDENPGSCKEAMIEICAETSFQGVPYIVAPTPFPIRRSVDCGRCKLGWYSYVKIVNGTRPCTRPFSKRLGVGRGSDHESWEQYPSLLIPEPEHSERVAIHSDHTVGDDISHHWNHLQHLVFTELEGSTWILSQDDQVALLVCAIAHTNHFHVRAYVS